MRDVRVEVVIPAFNAAPYIERALASVYAQQLRPKRVIVVDDGSLDDTEERVKSFAATHPDLPMLCIRQTNAGVSAARNRALQEVDADFVAFLDADDEWEPLKLARQMKLFIEDVHGRLGLVYCNYSHMDPDSRTLDLEGCVSARVRGAVHRKLLKGNFISGSCSAAVLRIEALRQAGGFDETLVCAEDWDLWLRVAQHWDVDFVPDVLVRIRQHSSNAQGDSLRMLGGELRFADKLLAQGGLRYLHLLRLRARMERLCVGIADFAPWKPSAELSARLQGRWFSFLVCLFTKIRAVVHQWKRR